MELKVKRFSLGSMGIVFFPILLLGCNSIDASSPVTGRVIKIADGDTLTILTADKESIRVRLTEIDAPERRQAFGNRSRQALADLCFEKQATLFDTGKDRYGRTLARVDCSGVDTNSEMVRLGMAWVYDRYVKDRTLYELQDQARTEKRGLWIDQKPIPPWRFRQQQ